MAILMISETISEYYLIEAFIGTYLNITEDDMKNISRRIRNLDQEEQVKASQ